MTKPIYVPAQVQVMHFFIKNTHHCQKGGNVPFHHISCMMFGSLFFNVFDKTFDYHLKLIKSRKLRHLNFDCQLNLSKSHKVWSSYLVPFRRSVEKSGWGGGGEKRPLQCETGLKNYR